MDLANILKRHNSSGGGVCFRCPHRLFLWMIAETAIRDAGPAIEKATPAKGSE
jgi:hypothetical protein